MTTTKYPTPRQPQMGMKIMGDKSTRRLNQKGSVRIASGPYSPLQRGIE